VNLEIISIVFFWGLLGILIYKDRKNIDFSLPLITRRTEKGKGRIKKIAKRHIKALKIFSTVSIFLAIILSIAGIILLSQFPGAKLVFPKAFPGEASEAVQQYVFFVPLWYWIISIFVITIFHELSHALVAITEKIKIKSMGAFLLLVFPGAFVEMDEKQFRKSKPSTRMKIAAVGSIGNVVVFLFLVLLIFFVGLVGSALFETNGVNFENTIQETPAHDIDLSGTIIKINSESVVDIYQFDGILASITPGENITITTSEGVYNLTTSPHPNNESKSYIGIGSVSTNLDYSEKFSFLGNPKISVSIFFWLSQLLFWVAFIDINVAVANLLPFLPFDGGILWNAIFEKFLNKKAANIITILLSFLTYSLLILNLVGIDRILSLIGIL